MLNPDIVKRLRSRLEKDEAPAEFEGYPLETVEVCLTTEDRLELIGFEEPWSGECIGPDRIFGKPADSSCLNDVGTRIRSVPAKRLFRAKQARVIGNKAIITANGEVFAPSPIQTGADVARVRELNGYDHDGYVFRLSDGKAFVHFAARREPRQIAAHVLFLHNTEPGNYGSFIFRQLPQMFLARQFDIKFDAYVVPDRTPWFFEALRLCDLPEKPVLTVREVSGDTFSSITIFNDFDAEGALSPSTIQSFQALGSKLELGKTSEAPRIFISRSLSTVARPRYRCLTNEAAIEQLASQSGFVVVWPETLTFSEQIRLFRGAKCVAGPSGSGMLTAGFCGEGVKLLDFESFHFTVRQHSKIYGSARLKYAFGFGDIDSSDTLPLHVRRWSIPIEIAKEGLEWLMEQDTVQTGLG